MIRLQNEGLLQPAPVLPAFAQQVSLAIQSWPEVTAATHWKLGNPTQVDGAEFHVPAGALGHIHLHGGDFHLALSKPLRNLLLERQLAHSFRWDAAWVERPIATAEDVEPAIWLFQLAYDRLRAATPAALLARIEARSAAT